MLKECQVVFEPTLRSLGKGCDIGNIRSQLGNQGFIPVSWNLRINLSRVMSVIEKNVLVCSHFGKRLEIGIGADVLLDIYPK